MPYDATEHHRTTKIKQLQTKGKSAAEPISGALITHAPKEALAFADTQRVEHETERGAKQQVSRVECQEGKVVVKEEIAATCLEQKTD